MMSAPIANVFFNIIRTPYLTLQFTQRHISGGFGATMLIGSIENDGRNPLCHGLRQLASPLIKDPWHTNITDDFGMRRARPKSGAAAVGRISCSAQLCVQLFMPWGRLRLWSPRSLFLHPVQIGRA